MLGEKAQASKPRDEQAQDKLVLGRTGPGFFKRCCLSYRAFQTVNLLKGQSMLKKF